MGKGSGVVCGGGPPGLPRPKPGRDRESFVAADLQVCRGQNPADLEVRRHKRLSILVPRLRLMQTTPDMWAMLWSPGSQPTRNLIPEQDAKLYNTMGWVSHPRRLALCGGIGPEIAFELSRLRVLAVRLALAMGEVVQRAGLAIFFAGVKCFYLLRSPPSAMLRVNGLEESGKDVSGLPGQT